MYCTTVGTMTVGITVITIIGFRCCATVTLFHAVYLPHRVTATDSWHLWAHKVSFPHARAWRTGVDLARFMVSVLSTDLCGITGKNRTNLCQDSRSLGRDFNSEPPEYEAVVPTSRPRCSIPSFIHTSSGQSSFVKELHGAQFLWYWWPLS
jgi:hypothetical protein